MNVLIAGAHGRLGQALTRRLVAAGHTVAGLLRDPGRRGDIEALGATAVVAGLTSGDLDAAVADRDCPRSRPLPCL